jgi:hypothetical protein
MIEHAPLTVHAVPRFGPDSQDFLTSHRAQAVAVREFNRVAEAFGAEAKRLATLGGHEKPVIRVSPCSSVPWHSPPPICAPAPIAQAVSSW